MMKSRNRILDGVCGGLAESMDLRVGPFRFIMAILGLATGILPFAVAYLVGMLVMEDPK